MPRLTVTRPNLEERLFEFEDGTITLGRAETNSVQLEEPAADPEHCLIEATLDGQFKLVDLETKNGTSVNGKKVNAHLLAHNDQIQVGQTCIRYEEPAPDAYKTARIQIIRPRRRGRTVPARRLPTSPPAPALAQDFTTDDLRNVLTSMVEQEGAAPALDAARRLLEQLHQEHGGGPLFEGLEVERDNLYRMM
ncbi:MAG TPA: FHA domain-containing protein, partial [Planctomycetota bacterium]|nr:FHA domain-containing protein [Planctomycetota bacterium]